LPQGQVSERIALRRNLLNENKESAVCIAMLDLLEIERVSCYIEFETCSDINRIFKIQGRLANIRALEDFILKPLPML
jgi:hypothetical protein